MTGKKNNKYSREFKQTIVNLYNSGKTYAQIHQEYGISHSALANWVKLYSEVQVEDNTVLTAKQIKELQKRNAQLEEGNLILKKPLQYSLHTQTKIRSCKAAFKRARYFDSVPCPQSKPKHLLQIH